jgi:hypothetical protein
MEALPSRECGGAAVDVDGGSALAVGVALTELTARAVWVRYFELGGALSRVRLDAYLTGSELWPAQEHDIASHALNEALWDSGVGSAVAYAGEL